MYKKFLWISALFGLKSNPKQSKKSRIGQSLGTQVSRGAQGTRGAGPNERAETDRNGARMGGSG